MNYQRTFYNDSTDSSIFTDSSEEDTQINKLQIYTLEELKKYGVDELKKLCTKHNINIKNDAMRTDYETALMKL
jgi:hypothetical protein